MQFYFIGSTRNALLRAEEENNDGEKELREERNHLAAALRMRNVKTTRAKASQAHLEGDYARRQIRNLSYYAFLPQNNQFAGSKEIRIF